MLPYFTIICIILQAKNSIYESTLGFVGLRPIELYCKAQKSTVRVVEIWGIWVIMVKIEPKMAYIKGCVDKAGQKMKKGFEEFFLRKKEYIRRPLAFWVFGSDRAVF